MKTVLTKREIQDAFNVSLDSELIIEGYVELNSQPSVPLVEVACRVLTCAIVAIAFAACVLVAANCISTGNRNEGNPSMGTTFGELANVDYYQKQ